MMPSSYFSVLLLSAIAGLSGQADAHVTPVSNCKAFPGSADWPSINTWSSLNKTLGGRLVQPTPPGAVCHKGQSSFNADECSSVAKAWTTDEFHAANPVSVMWDQYANYTCLPQSNTTCTSNGYPAYVVIASTPEHIQAGLEFARKHNVRLNVKSTGHDYMGRANAPGTLSIWMHNFNAISHHANSYKLAGSGRLFNGSAVTVGSGAMMWDIYQATAKFNQTVVGGGAKTVSAGGYISGGGHSILSPRYGLAADNVLEMQVVTACGKILAANQDQNRDLFWALRGGGGSTFGIVTSITMKTYPSPKITSVSWLVLTDPKAPFLNDMVGYVASQSPYLLDSGFSGYNFVTLGMPKPAPIPGVPDIVAGVYGTMILQDNNDPDAANKIFKPINDTIVQQWKGAAFMIVAPLKQYDSFLAWFSESFDSDPAGGSIYVGSRLLDKQAFSDSKALGNALVASCEPDVGMSYFLIGGKGIAEAKPVGQGNSVNTAFRSAYAHALSSVSFPALNKAAEAVAKKKLDESFEPLRKLTPSSGAYINENWQQVFWGKNYERLLSIKRREDPHDLFWCAPCVGSERWQQKENGQLCRV